MRAVGGLRTRGGLGERLRGLLGKSKGILFSSGGEGGGGMVGERILKVGYSRAKGYL